MLPEDHPELYPLLAFYPQNRTFLGGADGSRTHALCRARARRRVLACPDASGDCAYLQVIRAIPTFTWSGASRFVPARLQYGCSTVTRQCDKVPRSLRRANVPPSSSSEGLIEHNRQLPDAPAGGVEDRVGYRRRSAFPTVELQAEGRLLEGDRPVEAGQVDGAQAERRRS